MSLCEMLDCDQPEVANTKLCAGHVQKFKDEGWRFLKNGTRVNRATGARVTPRGKVTVEASYNPRMMALLAGEIDVKDLDDEELARGMTRDESGRFPRKQINMVPKAMYNQMTKVLFERADARLREGLVEAVDAVVKMIGSDDVDANVKLQASKWVFERLRGKVPDEIKLTQDKPYEQILTHIHRGPREQKGSAEEAELVAAPVVEQTVGPSPTRVQSPGRHSAPTPGADRAIRRTQRPPSD